MSIRGGTNVQELQQELEKEKKSLKDINENIVRITGRRFVDGKFNRDGGGAGGGGGVGAVRNAGLKRGDYRTKPYGMNGQNQTTTPGGGAQMPDGGGGNSNNNNGVKARLNSHVICKMPSKDKIVEAQGTDAVSKERHRRMFGSLLGTLQKFREEESRLKPKEAMKAQIERKVEEQEISERRAVRKEREQLAQNKETKESNIKKLEEKISRLRDYETWERAKLPLANLIRTATKPHIYYRPRALATPGGSCSGRIEKLLAKNRDEINEQIKQRKAQLQTEIAHLEIVEEIAIKEEANAS